jgi:hypothetical protein
MDHFWAFTLRQMISCKHAGGMDTFALKVAFFFFDWLIWKSSRAHCTRHFTGKNSNFSRMLWSEEVPIQSGALNDSSDTPIQFEMEQKEKQQLVW